MEDKKRRRRLKTDSNPLEERSNPKSNQSPEFSSSLLSSEDDIKEKTPYIENDRPPSQERSERSFNNDRGGYNRPSHDENRGGYDNRNRNYDRPRDENRGGYNDRRESSGGYNDRNNRTEGGGYNNDRRDSGGYNRENRDGYNNDRSVGGGGYNRGGGGYNNDRRESGDGYNNDRGAYNNDRRESGGGYNNDRGAYNNDRRESGGGYNNDRGAYNNDRRESGGGYNNNRGAYNNDRRESGGGYNNNRGAYNNDRRGGGSGYNRGGGGGYNRGGGGGRRFPKEAPVLPPEGDKPDMPTGEGMPLNKYLAHCGASSRRKAVEYIHAGQVTVNGEVQKQPFYRLEPTDVVTLNGETLNVQERHVYLLFNKPKNVITTTDDENGRATVMDFVDPHFPERLYPVGRLDRDTTGLIVITNDGDFAKILTHPSHNIFKQYRVTLDKNFREADMAALARGISLEDGPAPVRWARLAEGKPHVVELEINIGRNRIVRRMFEHLGYRVNKLDRFYIGGLTKKLLKRGSYRELTHREIMNLKHFAVTVPMAEREDEENDTDTND